MIFIIIQARMTSTRLPGKVMLPVCGKPVLQLMLERLDVFRDNIIIATTNDGSERPIVDLCNRLAIRVFQGDTDNVLERFYQTATFYGAVDTDIIVRQTSDCPLIDPEITRNTINYYQAHDFDYVSAGTGAGFPRGMDTEVFSYALLKEAWQNATELYEKEHVTPYFYKTKRSKLSFGQYKNTGEHSRYRLTLDEESDYQAIQEMYKKLHCRTDFGYDEMIAVLQKYTYIYELNAAIEQKKLS